MINQKTIRQWWDVFHSDNPLVEVRILNKVGKGVKTYSGYFTSVDLLIEELVRYDGLGIYAPINLIKDACYSRVQHDRIMDSPENTTSDSDIEARLWILIDIDPERATGVNASDEEKRCARDVLREVGCFLRDEGFYSPVIMDSANGYHAYYRVNLANTKENAELIKNFLKVLDMLFSTDRAKVDVSVFNAARIAKIAGTTSAKGASTKERPQRESCFVKIPDEIKATDIAFIKKVASRLPKEEKPSRFNGYSSERFDLDDFISRHNIEVARKVRFASGTKYVLSRCPFDDNHKAPDSALFLMDSGAIGFRCLHNSCSSYTWHDVRILFEPDAYSRRDYEEFQARRGSLSTEPKPTPIVVEESAKKGKKWQSLRDVQYIDPSTLTYIETGFTQLDRKIGGMALGDVTIISGLAGAGKSSIINCITLNAIQHGYKVAVWSGELQASRFQAWIDQAAAGKNFVKQKAGYENWYYAPRDVSEKINAWLDGKLFLYNNEYGSKWSQLFADVKECVTTNSTQLVVLDNLMSLSLDAFSGEKNERQTQFINELKTYAKSANISVILVAHPRKEMSNALLRMESISGSFDLVNLVDNIFLAHRVGRDFNKRATEFFGDDVVREMSNYNEVIEVAKNRALGIKDFLVGLYFEVESRRYKNDIAEHIRYDWQERGEQMSIPAIMDDIPSDTSFVEGMPEF